MAVVRMKNDRIFKYPLEVADRQVIPMPELAEVLCVQVQDGQPYVWARVDTNRDVEDRVFFVAGTGHPMPVRAGRYVGTLQTHDGRFVGHVFEGKE